MSSTALTIPKDDEPDVVTLVAEPFSLRPANLAEAMEFATIIAKSDLVPKDYRGRPENCLIAVQMGAEIGLPPMQAIQGIAVINGRPSVWGDALRALILSAPDLQDIVETDDGAKATCTITRRGRSPVTHTFSMEDAKAAGLAGKEGPWRSYPKRMRQNRAFAFAARDAYADRLKGLASAEEQQDIQPSTVISEPQRLPVATPAASVTPAAPTTEPKPENGGEQWHHCRILDTKFVSAQGALKQHYEITTSRGVLATASEALYREACTCEGSPLTFTLHVKEGRRGDGKRVMLLLQIEQETQTPASADDPSASGDGSTATPTEQGGLLG
jgi:hypothetical protein